MISIPNAVGDASNLSLLPSPLNDTDSQMRVQTNCIKPILAVDGGGVRGIIPLTYLSAIEIKTNLVTSELFEIFAGASIGGMICSALNIEDPAAKGKPKYTAQAFAAQFQEMADVIFHRSFLREIPGERLFTAKYSDEGLTQSIGSVAQDYLFKDALKEVIVPSWELLPSRRVRFFNSRPDRANHVGYFHNGEPFTAAEEKEIKNLKFYDVMNAGVRAPTYFNPYSRTIAGTDRLFIDGGIFANNPSSLAHIAGEVAYGSDKNLFLLSLGTGQAPLPSDLLPTYSGYVSVAPGIVEEIMDATSDCGDVLMDWRFSAMKQRHQYHRLQIPIAEESLDNVNNIPILQAAAEADIKKRAAEIEAICDQLIRAYSGESYKIPLETYG